MQVIEIGIHNGVGWLSTCHKSLLGFDDFIKAVGGPNHASDILEQLQLVEFWSYHFADLEDFCQPLTTT